MEFLIKHKLINPSQHGFLNAKSCPTNVLCLFEELTKWVDDGSPVDVICMRLPEFHSATIRPTALFASIHAICVLLHQLAARLQAIYGVYMMLRPIIVIFFAIA